LTITAFALGGIHVQLDYLLLLSLLLVFVLFIMQETYDLLLVLVFTIHERLHCKTLPLSFLVKKIHFFRSKNQANSIKSFAGRCDDYNNADDLKSFCSRVGYRSCIPLNFKRVKRIATPVKTCFKSLNIGFFGWEVADKRINFIRSDSA
jgi:hypothetical protein